MNDKEYCKEVIEQYEEENNDIRDEIFCLECKIDDNKRKMRDYEIKVRELEEDEIGRAHV